MEKEKKTSQRAGITTPQETDPRRLDLIARLKPFFPVGEWNRRKAFLALIDKSPPPCLTDPIFREIISQAKSLDEIVDQILHLKPHRNKRIDAFYVYAPTKKRSKANNRGRKKSSDYDTYREAEVILRREHLQTWKDKFGVEPEYYDLLQYSVIDTMLYEGKHENIYGISKEAISHMADEIVTLLQVWYMFKDEVRRAKKSNNTLILNTVREVFGDDADGYLGEYKKGRGDKVGRATIARRFERFLGYIRFTALAEKSGTFYNRDKPTYLCVLAWCVDRTLQMPLTVKLHELEREKAILQIQLLAAQHSIKPHEAYPEIAHLVRPMGLLASKIKKVHPVRAYFYDKG